VVCVVCVCVCGALVRSEHKNNTKVYKFSKSIGTTSKFLRSRGITSSKFQTGDQEMSGATAQNVFVRASGICAS